MEKIKTKVKDVQRHCIDLIDELNIRELPFLRVQVEHFMKQLNRIEGFAEGVIWQDKNRTKIDESEEED